MGQLDSACTAPPQHQVQQHLQARLQRARGRQHPHVAAQVECESKFCGKQEMTLWFQGLKALARCVSIGYNLYSPHRGGVEHVGPLAALEREVVRPAAPAQRLRRRFFRYFTPLLRRRRR
jgi:hypothetical protein